MSISPKRPITPTFVDEHKQKPHHDSPPKKAKVTVVKESPPKRQDQPGFSSLATDAASSARRTLFDQLPTQAQAQPPFSFGSPALSAFDKPLQAPARYVQSHGSSSISSEPVHASPFSGKARALDLDNPPQQLQDPFSFGTAAPNKSFPARPLVSPGVSSISSVPIHSPFSAAESPFAKKSIASPFSDSPHSSQSPMSDRATPAPFLSNPSPSVGLQTHSPDSSMSSPSPGFKTPQSPVATGSLAQTQVPGELTSASLAVHSPMDVRVSSEASLSPVPEVDIAPKFPLENIMRSLERAMRKERIDGKMGSPLTAEDLKALEIFCTHYLQDMINWTNEQGQGYSDLRAGYSFEHEGVTYTLTRTIEFIDNLLTPGATPYLCLNRLGNHSPEEVKPILDRLVGKGTMKFAKFAINLYTGELVIRLTMEDNASNRHEIEVHKQFNGQPGIIPLLGCTQITSKHLVNGKPVNKIGLFLPYCEHGDLFDFIVGKKINALYPPDQIQKQQLNLVRSCFEGLRTLHTTRKVKRADGVLSTRYVHRDVKPENFLVYQDANGDLSAFVIDLGFAKIQGPDAQACGSPLYVCPELTISLFPPPVTVLYYPSNDMWSFGIVLYALKFGYFPAEIDEAGKDKHGVMVKLCKLFQTKTAEWKQRKRTSLIDREMRCDISRQDQLLQVSLKDPILYLAFQCLRMNPQTRLDSKNGLKYCNEHPLLKAGSKSADKDRDEKKAKG